MSNARIIFFVRLRIDAYGIHFYHCSDENIFRNTAGHPFSEDALNVIKSVRINSMVHGPAIEFICFYDHYFSNAADNLQKVKKQLISKINDMFLQDAEKGSLAYIWHQNKFSLC